AHRGARRRCSRPARPLSRELGLARARRKPGRLDGRRPVVTVTSCFLGLLERSGAPLSSPAAGPIARQGLPGLAVVPAAALASDVFSEKAAEGEIGGAEDEALGRHARGTHVGGELRREVERRRFQLIRGYDPVHEALPVRSRGVPGFAEEHHLTRRAHADQTRQAVGREAGDDAVADGGEAEGRVLARDAEVAAEGDLQAAPEAGALDRGDGGDGDRLDLREGDVPAPEPVRSQPIAGERREVDARAEGPAATADDDRARLLVALGEGRGAVEVVDRVVIRSIELLGARELEAADAVPAGGRVPGVRGAPRAGLHLLRSSRTRIALPSLRGSVRGATISATTARP